MTDHPYEAELRAALHAARLGAAFAALEYETFAAVPEALATITTHVDLAVQELVLNHLRATFPADGVVAEEDTPTARGTPAGAGRVWVVDPIDGTRGFALKTGEFSVMIALTVDRVPVVGVVAEPARQRVTFAAAGHGCWVEDGHGATPTRCRVTTTAVLELATLTQSHTKPGTGAKPVVTALAPGRVIETYSAGVKLAQVARGEADLYANDYTNFHDWDICAGHILVTEAGGTVSLFDGSPVTYGGPGVVQRRGMLATNGTLHAAAVARLAGV